MTLYVVSLYRGGFRDNSSFPLGVFSTREKAERAGRRECTGRGYKYGYEISELKLDHYEEDAES